SDRISKEKERQDNTVMRYQALKRKLVTEAQARKNMMAFLEKGENEIEEEESKESKRKSENLEQKAAKKQKINKETEELKTHLQIVLNDEDDVYTEATPLALKRKIWISKSQELEAIRILWSSHHHFHNYLDDPAEIVDNAWIKHSKDQFRAPTAQDIEILIQTCLMPLAIKTQNDSFKFVHELKQEMHADLKYVESFEKEMDELESDKAEFLDMYDVILQECKMTVCNEKASNVFRKEREQYIKIQDLKAQLQDKKIAIRELKKLIEKGKGKSVDTKFDKPFVVRQPNAQRIPKLSVLGKPAPFSNSIERIYFPNIMLVSKDTAQTLPQIARKAVSNINVLKPGMYRIENRSTQTRAPQSPQTVRNTNTRVSTST
nr:hypothetical protein [Tanacetum cinerariifolium]